MLTFPPAPGQLEREKRERHKRWLSLLSEADWGKIHALARQVSPSFTPARIEDLDAGFAVQCVPAESAFRHSGEVIGTVREKSVAILVYAD